MKIATFFIFFTLISCSYAADKDHDFLDCRNALLYKGVSFTACKDGILIKDIEDNWKNLFSEKNSNQFTFDDLAIADDFLFVISMKDVLRMYDIKDPRNPILVDVKKDVPAKFYTGIEARDGYVIVSGGLKNSSLITYSARGLDKVKTLNEVSNYFGRPNVAILKNEEEAEASKIKVVFSLDVFGTYKWGIHIFTLENGKLTEGQFIPLESGFRPIELLSYAPANFPILSAMIDNKIYVTHWKTKEILLIESSSVGLFTTVVGRTDFIVSHMVAEGRYLYFVSKEKANCFFRFDPVSGIVETIEAPGVQEPMNISIEGNNWVIADKKAGLKSGQLSH